jgi:hypothetical protein
MQSCETKLLVFYFILYTHCETKLLAFFILFYLQQLLALFILFYMQCLGPSAPRVVKPKQLQAILFYFISSAIFFISYPVLFLFTSYPVLFLFTSYPMLSCFISYPVLFKKNHIQCYFLISYPVLFSFISYPVLGASGSLIKISTTGVFISIQLSSHLLLTSISFINNFFLSHTGPFFPINLAILLFIHLL